MVPNQKNDVHGGGAVCCTGHAEVQLFCKQIEELNSDKLVYLGKEYKDIVIFHKKTKIHTSG
eukprot:1389295-Rhodomonas_salina.1